MSAVAGLGLLESAALQAVVDAGGAAGAPHVRTSTVLELMERRHGVGARYLYPLLQDLAAPWRLHLPMLDGQGNLGSQHGDPAAEPQYTELRLSPVGTLALAAERGEVGPVPLGIVEGSLYRGGPVPPFAPRAVLSALVDGAPDAGPPVTPTGGTVTGMIPALLAGGPARLALGCTIVTEPGRLVITEVPLGVAVSEVAVRIADRVNALNVLRDGRGRADYLPPGQRPEREPPAPVVDLRDTSSPRVGVRIELQLRPGTDPAAARAWVESIWPVTITVDCRLPAPIRRILAEWDRGDGTGLTALSGLLPAEPGPWTVS
jgi:hypothetical protein